eukprot:TRINITY_DN63520_c0_g1_i1.p1 TRINITY_DN63520_c0_g1~~TRINITY_DN63520_c0_g1_i1.p1  ORF type:complete len:274 (+),score=84.78 TRINITY_DN63520_c0_g1_i1:109-930(+)
MKGSRNSPSTIFAPSMPHMMSLGEGYGTGGGGGGIGDMQDVAEAREALEAAMRGSSIAALRAAITAAGTIGVGAAVLAAASDRLRALQEMEREREAAEEALVQAVEASAEDPGDNEALAAALARAAEVGVDEELLSEAKATLESREALAALVRGEPGESKRKPCSLREAEQALEIAAAGDDVEAFEAAIAQARAAGSSQQTLAEANEALAVVRELAEAKANAEQSLARAVAGCHAGLLEAAIALAEECGVAEDAVEAARAKLSVLTKCSVDGL